MTAGQQGGPLVCQPDEVPRSRQEWFALAMYCFGVDAGMPKAKVDSQIRFWWPLMHFKLSGIEQGRQWHVLGWLAARYARRLGVDALASELWEVVQASSQNPRHPWTWQQITGIAARAKRFIDREDTKAASTYAAWQAHLRTGGAR